LTLKTYYDESRALFPLLPQFFAEYEGGITPGFEGIIGGLPQFQIPKNYTLMPHEGWHEAGHAYLALLQSADPSKDYLGLFWTFTKRPGTWQQALQQSALLSGNEAWQTDPRERWADAFADGVGGDLPLRSFFQSLSAAGTVLQPVQDSVQIDWVGPIPGSNFMPGRDGNPISVIVDHWMAGTFIAADAHFRNPAAKVSAHYGITRDGQIKQWVADGDTAYHAGNWTANLISIGIEHEASPTMPPTPEVYAASARLHAYLSEKHGIPLELGETVKPHNSIVPTACPGTLDLERIIELAGGLMPEYATKEQLDALARDVKESLEAIKTVLATQAHHKHPSTEREAA